jgi:hypothetical protein
MHKSVTGVCLNNGEKPFGANKVIIGGNLSEKRVMRIIDRVFGLSIYLRRYLPTVLQFMSS